MDCPEPRPPCCMEMELCGEGGGDVVRTAPPPVHCRNLLKPRLPRLGLPRAAPCIADAVTTVSEWTHGTGVGFWGGGGAPMLAQF